MRWEEFTPQMDRLSKTFGKVYSEERMKLLWQEVKDLSGAWLSRTVDKFIGECRQAPLLPEFREEIRSASTQDRGIPVNAGKCELCSGQGWILPPYDPHQLDPPVAMRCECRGGARALANRIRTQADGNPELADQIEATFRRISPGAFRHQGFGDSAPRYAAMERPRVDPASVVRGMLAEEEIA